MSTKELNFFRELIENLKEEPSMGVFIVEEDRDYDMFTFAGVPYETGWGKEIVKKGVYVYSNIIRDDFFCKYISEITFPLTFLGEEDAVQLYYFDTDNIREVK